MPGWIFLTHHYDSYFKAFKVFKFEKIELN